MIIDKNDKVTNMFENKNKIKQSEIRVWISTLN